MPRLHRIASIGYPVSILGAIVLAILAVWAYLPTMALMPCEGCRRPSAIETGATWYFLGALACVIAMVVFGQAKRPPAPVKLE